MVFRKKTSFIFIFHIFSEDLFGSECTRGMSVHLRQQLTCKCIDITDVAKYIRTSLYIAEQHCVESTIGIHSCI